MSGLQRKSFDHPDERVTFDHGVAVRVEVGHLSIGRSVLEPGWRWSTHIRPIVGGESCRFRHVIVHLSGVSHVRLDDSTEFDLVPGDVVDVPAGHDAWVVGDDPVISVDILGGRGWGRVPLPGERALMTLLFTDIVDSTVRAGRLGDTTWRRTLSDHYELMRIVLDRFGGHEVATTGDGMLASLDSPGFAIRAGRAAAAAARDQGLELRAGVHTGEVEVAGPDVRGITVHMAQRIMSLAQPGELLVSALTRSLVSETDIHFVDRGEHELRGIEGRHRLFAADVVEP